MKLIHKPTGKEITVGSILPNNDEVIYCAQPHKPSSEGKMQTKDIHGEVTGLYYCSCFDCEWIEREDREEEPLEFFTSEPPTPVGDTSQAIYNFTERNKKNEQAPASPASLVSKPSSLVNSPDQSFELKKLKKICAELQDRVNQIETEIDGYLDGSGDCSPISQLANKISHIINS